MQRRLRPAMTPAEQRRQHVAFLRQERLLEDELKMAHALLQLIEESELPMERAMSSRRIRTHFPDVSDQAVPSGVVGACWPRLDYWGT